MSLTSYRTAPPRLPARYAICATSVKWATYWTAHIDASLRDVVGGRSQTMQRGLREARETALDDLRTQALDLGADAVVSVDLDYSEISGGGKSMLFLVVSGTAVRLADDGAGS